VLAINSDNSTLLKAKGNLGQRKDQLGQHKSYVL